MANNRMYIECELCSSEDDEFINKDSTFLLAKYYPSTGWYYWTRGTFQGLRMTEDRMTEFNGWMAKHRHYNNGRNHDINDGPTHFKLTYEVV